MCWIGNSKPTKTVDSTETGIHLPIKQKTLQILKTSSIRFILVKTTFPVEKHKDESGAWQLTRLPQQRELIRLVFSVSPMKTRIACQTFCLLKQTSQQAFQTEPNKYNYGSINRSLPLVCGVQTIYRMSLHHTSFVNSQPRSLGVLRHTLITKLNEHFGTLVKCAQKVCALALAAIMDVQFR